MIDSSKITSRCPKPVLLVVAGLCLVLGACAIPPTYAPLGDRATQARIRVKADYRYPHPAIVSVKAIDDVEPKEQFLAIFIKGWMGMSGFPKEAERIGMPETTGLDATLPVLERYITGNRELRLKLEATLDGGYLCGETSAFTPVAGHDYELVIPLRTTSLGGNGECGFVLYEIDSSGTASIRQRLSMRPLPVAKK